MKSRGNLLFIFGTLLAVLFFAAAVSADVVTLKSGEAVVGVVRDETQDGVVIDTPIGTTTIPRANIESVEYEDAARNAEREAELSPSDRDVPAIEEDVSASATAAADVPGKIWYEGELLSIESILDRLTDATAARNAAERRIVDQAEEIDRLQDSLTARGARAARLEREAAQRESELDAAYADLHASEDSAQTLRRDLDYLENELHDTKHQLHVVRDKLDRCRDHLEYHHHHGPSCRY